MVRTVETFSGFSVDNENTAKDFYTNTLGLELIEEQMGLRFKLPGGGTIFAYPKPNHEPATFTILNFVVEDIDDAVDELTAKGANFEHYESMPVKQDEKGIMRSTGLNTGPSIAWFKDPAGNVLSVIQADN
jgi:catechol 2,3-dioxygenase-like lactoylglutathione lyase family enzyme